MCQRLNCSYAELLAMPEDVYDLWRMFMAGEGRAASEKAAGGG